VELATKIDVEFDELLFGGFTTLGGVTGSAGTKVGLVIPFTGDSLAMV
jgi:hypothetical protein